MLVPFREDWEAYPCKLWTGALRTNGYGRTGTDQSAHVQAWFDAGNTRPKGTVVMHACNVKACHEVAHLGLGSYANNANQAVEDGLWVLGEDRIEAKLSNSDVVDIKTMLSIPCPHGKGSYCRKPDCPRVRHIAIAEMYNVVPATIDLIAEERTWKHVTVGCEF